MPGRRSLGLEVALCAALLAACGGGGGGAAPAEFSLQAANAARVATGYSLDFVVNEMTNNCTGSATQTAGKPVPATFEGVAAIAVTNTQSLTLANCGTAGTLGGSATAVDYYDSAFGAIGSTTGGQYGVYQPLPAMLPDSVRAGDQGSVGTQTLYTDSSKTTVASRVRYGYAVSADTSTTLAVVLTAQGYDPADNLQFSESDHFRLGADGRLTLVFADIQYAGTNGLHLVLTPR